MEANQTGVHTAKSGSTEKGNKDKIKQEVKTSLKKNITVNKVLSKKQQYTKHCGKYKVCEVD